MDGLLGVAGIITSDCGSFPKNSLRLAHVDFFGTQFNRLGWIISCDDDLPNMNVKIAILLKSYYRSCLAHLQLIYRS